MTASVHFLLHAHWADWQEFGQHVCSSVYGWEGFIRWSTRCSCCVYLIMCDAYLTMLAWPCFLNACLCETYGCRSEVFRFGFAFSQASCESTVSQVWHLMALTSFTWIRDCCTTRPNSMWTQSEKSLAWKEPLGRGKIYADPLSFSRTDKV